MDYIKVTFRTEDNEEYTNDLIASFLGEIGFESFEETMRGIIGYCPIDQYNEDTMKETIKMLPIANISLISYKVDTIKDQNWNVVWEQNGYEPIDINGQIIIHAADKVVDKKYDYDIIINPVQSFGTGYHETTRMILTFVSEMELAGKSVLDMGCGTAVLGIMAKMRGADKVTSIDIDPWSVRNAEDNVKINNLNGFDIRLGDADILNGLKDKFDLVFANINRNILLNDMQAYVNSMKLNAEIILSGFYIGDIQLIKDKADSLGLKYIEHKESNEWVAVKFRKSAI